MIALSAVTFALIAVVPEKHLPPRNTSHGRNNYQNINKCRDCGVICHALEHQVYYPCEQCGGQLKREGVAKWVPGVYSESIWWRPSTWRWHEIELNPGHWEMSKHYV